MRRVRTDAGIDRGTPSPLLRLLPLLIFLPVLALVGYALLAAVLPRGMPWEGERVHEGLLHVPDEGFERAIWTSVELLRENAAAPVGAPQKSHLVCVAPLAAIEQALAHAPREPRGGKSIWVRMVAETRLGDWPCLQGRSGSGRLQLGDALHARRVLEAKPLGCDSILFIVNDLRCPAPVRTGPRVLDDSAGDIYPEAARRAGAEGATTVRMLVQGRSEVLSCQIVRSSGNRDLDEASCPLMRRRPDLISARGRTQGLAAGVREVTQSVQWRLTKADPALIAR